MKKLFKRSRFYIGVIFIIQMFTMVVLFFSQFRKRKSLSAAFAALAVFSGGVGALLITKGAKDEQERLSVLDALCGEYMYVDDDDSIFCRKKGSEDIPVTDNIDESEFDS